jgi:DNA-binding NarL/FixJ family response regulator
MAISGLAASAESAIEMAASFRPDIALLDMNMPGGGLEAALGIRVACPQTRMLAFSVRRDKDAVIAMLRAGASGYLLKGTRPPRIISGIVQALRGQAVLSPELGRHVTQELTFDHELAPMVTDRPVRVMAVDDDLAVVAAVGELIKGEAGLQLVGTATNVDDAIMIAASTHPDVALVDVRMPEWGGERVAFELALVSPTTRILAFSASDDADEVVAMLRGGAVGYIVKGYGSQELTNNIRACAGGHTVLEIGSDVMHTLVGWPRLGPYGAWAATA